MIKEYVTGLASQMGIKLSRITLTEGKPLGCLDAHLLGLESEGHMAEIFIRQSELNDIQNSYLLELKIKSALVRLEALTAP